MPADQTPDRQQRGRDAEALACHYLQQQGMRLLERNYRCRSGEIDLVMDHDGTTVFVEVRLRNNLRFGSGADSVDNRKQHKLAIAAQHYLQHHRARRDQPARFDVISIHQRAGQSAIDWIDNAFHT